MTDKGLVLVTGASGFVGKWTVIELLKAGYPRARHGAHDGQGRPGPQVGDRAGGRRGSLARLELVEADILDDKGWADAMRGVAAVMHVATAIRADEPQGSEPRHPPRDRGHGARAALRPCRRHQALHHHLIDRHRRLRPWPHHRPARLHREHFTNLDGMKWTWAYCIGKTKAERPPGPSPRRTASVSPPSIPAPSSARRSTTTPASRSAWSRACSTAQRRPCPATASPSSTSATSPTCTSPRWKSRRRSASATSRPPNTCRSPKIGEILREAYPRPQGHDASTVPDWLIKLHRQLRRPRPPDHQRHRQREELRRHAKAKRCSGENTSRRRTRSSQPRKPRSSLDW